jgi:uncharacterized protein YndB with AHSA1/START domain
MKQEPFIIERTYNASIHDVWKAITDKDEMKQWYFNLEEFKPEIGFEFKFKGGPEDGIQYIHTCEITEVIVEKKLTYSWSYDGFTGKSFVTFELFLEGNKTRLKLTHEGLATFPSNNPDFARTNFVEGWNQLINISLRNYLEKA